VQGPAEGKIVAVDEVGGLHHRYERLAARMWASEAAHQVAHPVGTANQSSLKPFANYRQLSRLTERPSPPQMSRLYPAPKPVMAFLPVTGVRIFEIWRRFQCLSG
jgi:hypothetical protein